MITHEILDDSRNLAIDVPAVMLDIGETVGGIESTN